MIPMPHLHLPPVQHRMRQGMGRYRLPALLLLLGAVLLGQAAAAVPDIFPASATRCPWSNRDNLQAVINASGSTGVSLDPSMDYSTLTTGAAQNLTLPSNTQLYAVNSRIGSITIPAGAHDIYISGVSSGTMTLQAGSAINRLILNRVNYFTLQGTGCRVDELTWFDAFNTNISLDCSSGGYVRNFRVIRDCNQNNTQPFALIGNSAEPSYGNIIVVGVYLTGGSPQGPRVQLTNVNEWLSLQMGAESYYAPQNPWFSPMGVKAVRAIGTNGLVQADHCWVTNSPDVLLVNDVLTTFNGQTATTTTTDHVFLAGVKSKVAISVPYPPQQWNPATTYGQYNQVYYGANGRYTSTSANNTGNVPSATSAFWSPQTYIGWDDEDDNVLSQVSRATLFDDQTTIAKTININGTNAPPSITQAAAQTLRATAAAPNTGLIPWNPPSYATPPSSFSSLPVQTMTAAQIQAQLDDLSLSGAVVLPAGIYTLSQPLLLGTRSDGTRRILIGAGKSQTVLRAALTSQDLIQEHNDGNLISSIDLIDLTLQGGRWGINLFSIMVSGDWAQRIYNDSLMSSVCIRDMSAGGVQLQNIYGMDNNAFQDVDFVNCPIGWQQLGGTGDSSGNNWTYMDKNLFLGCQWIGCGAALNLVQGNRPSNVNNFLECLFSGSTTGVLTNGAQVGLLFTNCDLVNNAGNPTIYNYGDTTFVSTRVNANPASGVVQSFYDGYIGIFEGCTFTQSGAGSATVIRTSANLPPFNTRQGQQNYDGRCTHFLNCNSTISVGEWYNGSSINCNFSNSIDLGLHLNGALVYAYSDSNFSIGQSAPLPPSSLSYTVLDPSLPSPQPGVLLCAHQYSNPLVPIPSGIPAITSAATVALGYNAAASFQVTASNSPTSFTAQALPPGLSINAGSGLISGTPTASGSYLVPLFAGNAFGSSGSLLTITVTGAGPGAPVFGTIPNPITGTTNVALTPQSLAAATATSYSAQNLPPGTSINAVSGLISGTPTSAGSSSALVLASNASGTSVQQVNFSISTGIPAFTSLVSNTTLYGYVGVPLVINAGAASATSYSASGLPAGVGISTTTGLISGTPTAAGNSNVIVQANGNGNSVTVNFTLTIITATPPQFGAIPNPIAALVGTPFSISVAATDNTTDAGLSTITYQIDTLPAGLALSGGTISGTPTAAGTSQSQLQATGLGGTTPVTLNWSITSAVAGSGGTPAPPGSSPAATPVGTGGGSGGGCGLGVGVALLSLFSLMGIRLRRLRPRPRHGLPCAAAGVTPRWLHPQQPERGGRELQSPSALAPSHSSPPSPMDAQAPTAHPAPSPLRRTRKPC
jgi:hypothetical protein